MGVPKCGGRTDLVSSFPPILLVSQSDMESCGSRGASERLRAHTLFAASFYEHGVISNYERMMGQDTIPKQAMVVGTTHFGQTSSIVRVLNGLWWGFLAKPDMRCENDICDKKK